MLARPHAHAGAQVRSVRVFRSTLSLTVADLQPAAGRRPDFATSMFWRRAAGLADGKEAPAGGAGAGSARGGEVGPARIGETRVEVRPSRRARAAHDAAAAAATLLSRVAASATNKRLATRWRRRGAHGSRTELATGLCKRPRRGPGGLRPRGAARQMNFGLPDNYVCLGVVVITSRNALPSLS